MRKILVAISLLVMFMFLVSCVPQQQLTDEELQAELAKLTPEEREALLKDLESKEKGAFAGQAIRAKYGGKVSLNVLEVTPARIKQVVSKLPSSAIPSCVPKFKYQLCFLDQTCGVMDDGCGGKVDCGGDSSCEDVKKPHCVLNKCRPAEFCEETDGGKDYFKHGVTTWGVPYGDGYENREDRCGINYKAKLPNGAVEGFIYGFDVPENVVDCNAISVGDIIYGNLVTEITRCMVREFFCETPTSQYATLSAYGTFDTSACPNGCKDGACLSEAAIKISPEVAKVIVQN